MYNCIYCGTEYFHPEPDVVCCAKCGDYKPPTVNNILTTESYNKNYYGGKDA